MSPASKPKKEFSVYFSQWLPEPSRMKDLTIVICPASKGWNDFGRHTRCQIIGRFDSKSHFSARLHIAFEIAETSFPGKDFDNADDPLFLLQRLKSWNTPNAQIPQRDVPTFFSILVDIGEYRALVRNLGPEKSRAILDATKDVVAASNTKPQPIWLTNALNSDAFNFSFLRNQETYFAFKKAGPILAGIELEEIGSASSEINLSFQLSAFRSPHNLQFRFASDDDLPRRISVLVGKNGVGKSRALSMLVTGILRNEGTNKSKNTISVTGANNSRVLVSRILAFGISTELGSTFPREQKSTFQYRKFSLSRSVRAKANEGLSDYIVQLARSKETIGNIDRFAIFQNALKQALPNSEIALPMRGRLSRRIEILASRYANSGAIPIANLRRGSEETSLALWASVSNKSDPVHVVNNKIYPLSSGQLSFVRFAALSSLFVENGSLLLLDEPESHLHPNFVSQFVGVLEGILEATGSIAVIATHSAYFVREVFRDQVQILRATPSSDITVERPRLKTFGADIGSISHFIFGEESQGQLLETLIQKSKSRQLTYRQAANLYKSDLSSEALMQLRRELDD